MEHPWKSRVKNFWDMVQGPLCHHLQLGSQCLLTYSHARQTEQLMDS